MNTQLWGGGDTQVRGAVNTQVGRWGHMAGEGVNTQLGEV